MYRWCSGGGVCVERGCLWLYIGPTIHLRFFSKMKAFSFILRWALRKHIKLFWGHYCTMWVLARSLNLQLYLGIKWPWHPVNTKYLYNKCYATVFCLLGGSQIIQVGPQIHTPPPPPNIRWCCVWRKYRIETIGRDRPGTIKIRFT